ncbi:MAG TPA: hypothetical protein PK857_01545 [Hyphomicrobium sp.]|nr:hypothetical protein [Hyphomicrobium sp.]HRO50008.1 hypothetical protein [Hyphomicrobium sp.]
MIARHPMPLLAMLLGLGVAVGSTSAKAEQPGHALAERFAAGAAEEDARRKAEETKRRKAEDAKRRKADEAEMLARAHAEALERKAAADKARAEEEAQEAKRIAEEERAEKARRLAEEQRAARERFIAEQVRAEEQRQRIADEKRLAEEKRIAAEQRAKEKQARAEAARIAEEKRIAEEERLAEQKRADEERQRAALEQRRTEQQRAHEERRRAEAAARLAEERRIAEERRLAEEQRLAEERRIAEAERLAESRRLALAAEREASHERRAERIRQLEAERTAKFLAALKSPMGLGVPGDRASASLTAPPAAKPAERVTILLVMKPGATGIRRFGKKTADPVLCSGANCWIGSGADRPAKSVTRGLALGPANTMGRRAGACNHRLACVYRDVNLHGSSASIQPIDLRVMRHDRREPLRLEADRSCRIVQGTLVCEKIYGSRSWRAWVIDEDLARKAGPAALAAALESGLAPSRSAALHAQNF